MAVEITSDNFEQYFIQTQDKFTRSLEQAEGARGCTVVTDLESIRNVLSMPGVRYSLNPITEPNAIAQAYVQIPYSILADALENMEDATDEASSAAEQATEAAGNVQTAIDNANTAAGTANTAAQNADASRQQIEANESTRQSNETTRLQNETTRQSNETTRINSEQSRASSEQGRVSAESGRVSAEQSRVSAEQGRVSQATSDHTRAESDHTASVNATNEASNVNAMLGGTGGIVTITVTNRNGTSDTREVGFRIAKVYPSYAAMQADYSSSSVQVGQFVIISSNVEDPHNAELYVKGSSSWGDPICDLSGAQGIKGDTPVITADSDGTIYSDGVKVTDVIKNVVANTNTWLTNTQTTWNNWFSDSLSNGVRKLWNDFWTSVNSQWNGFFGTSADDANGVRKIWSTWYNATQTAWNNFWPAAKNTWESWFGTSTANGVQKQWADLKSDAQTQTQAARDAASDAYAKGNTAQAQGNVAEQKGNAAKTKGDTAEGQGNTAQTQGNTAEQKGDYAKTQGDYAKAWVDHPPFIGDGTTGDLNYWYLYNITTAQYVKSIYAKGDDLHWDDMSAAEKERLINEMLTYLETQGFDAVPTENSTKPVRSGGIYTALEEKEDKNNVASIQTCEDIIDELI